MRNYKSCMKYLGVLLVALIFAPGVAFAEGMGGETGLVAIGSGVAIGLAALGGTLGQGKTASAVLDAIGRNPSASGKLLLPMIIGLAFIESLVALSFAIAFILSGKF